MDIEKVHPELRDKVKRMPGFPLYNRFFYWLFKLLEKFLSAPEPVEGVSVTEARFEGGSVRVYRPEGELSGAGLLWIHGGGLIVGTAKMNDRECSLFAKELGIVVVSAEYRVAPKHPFPAALDDCLAAWQWFQQSADELGVDSKRIAIAGQSAGGGLTAALVQRVYDLGGVQPVAQGLFCPMLDDRTAARKELDEVAHLIWNNRNNRFGWSSYLGCEAGAAQVPEYAVPARREDLSGLPPAWVGVGDIDLFYEEDCNYAERLQAAGVPCEQEIVPMAPHGFEGFCPDAEVSRDFMNSFKKFLRGALGL